MMFNISWADSRSYSEAPNLRVRFCVGDIIRADYNTKKMITALRKPLLENLLRFNIYKYNMI